MHNKKINIAIAATAVMAILVIYYFFNPLKYSFFPQCPFHKLTGLDCPGCGSQRAVHALLHGNIKLACSYNILLVLSLPLLAVHFGYKAAAWLYKKDIRLEILYHPITPKIIAAIVIVFWIARNIPVQPFSYLAANH